MAKLNKVLLTSTALACAIALPAFAKKKDPSKAPKVVSSGKKMKLKMYGQITRTASIVDNGVATGFGNSENGNTSSRMGVTAEGDIDKSLKLKLRYEWNMRSAHDNRQQQNINDGLDNDFDIRHADIQFHHKRFGAIYFGRGHGPGNSSSQTDLSGTSTGAKGGGEHWDFQGGRMVETTASANGGRRSRVSPNIIYTNMDASNRSNRIRYDSPSIHGFQFRTGILDQDGYEFALWYKGKIAGWKIAGAINHSHGKQGLFPGEVRSSTTGTDTEISLYNGSISVQSPWGIGASGAGGFNVRSKTPAINNANDGNSPHFWWVAIWYRAKFFELGETRFKYGFQTTVNNLFEGDVAQAHGFTIVQNIKNTGTDAYVGYRRLSLDRDIAGPPGQEIEVEDQQAWVLGFRARF